MIAFWSSLVEWLDINFGFLLHFQKLYLCQLMKFLFSRNEELIILSVNDLLSLFYGNIL